MTGNKWQHALWLTLKAAAIITILVPHRSSLPTPWQILSFQNNSFELTPGSIPSCSTLSASPSPNLPPVPDTWQIAASTWADATNDGAPEWVLLVWRPWRDWPIQKWTNVPSPVAGFQDGEGDSCQLILLDPRDGRTDLAVGDVDGDGYNEVVTLEGSYAAGRHGPATHVDVWQWNDFGFTMEYRSPPGILHELGLTDGTGDGTLDVAFR